MAKTKKEAERAIVVRKMIEAGLADSDAGRVVDISEIRRLFGLPN